MMVESTRLDFVNSFVLITNIVLFFNKAMTWDESGVWKYFVGKKLFHENLISGPESVIYLHFDEVSLLPES